MASMSDANGSKAAPEYVESREAAPPCYVAIRTALAPSHGMSGGGLYISVISILDFLQDP